MWHHHLGIPEQLFRGSIPSPHFPLSTLRLCPHGHLRMTRGRCGWLNLQRVKLSFTTTHRSPGARRLTPRSSGAPTAGHQGPAGGTPYIFTGRALASCRRLPLTSNVRRRRNHLRLSSRVNACIEYVFCYHPGVNSTHKKTLERLLADPVNGNIEWTRIESMLKGAGCRVVEGSGSSVTFEANGRKMTLHRPHPGKEALRYRVLAVREFLEKAGIKP